MKNRFKQPIIIVMTVLLLGQTSFAEKGTSDHGGSSIIDRILLGRFYAKKIIAKSKDERLTPERKATMIDVLSGFLSSSKEPVKIINQEGKEVEVFAKYDSKTREITYGENRIRDAKIALYEATVLSLHEAGHSVGLSKNMAESRADFMNDIGYQLLLETLDSKEDLLAEKIFNDTQAEARDIACTVAFVHANGNRQEITFERNAEFIRKNRVIISDDIVPGVNVHIYYDGSYSYIAILHRATEALISSESEVHAHSGTKFSVFSRQPFANLYSRVGASCSLKEPK